MYLDEQNHYLFFDLPKYLPLGYVHDRLPCEEFLKTID